jgi:hypothetical protein
MPITPKETIAELDFLSDKVSTQVRWLAAGVGALL